MRNMEFLSLLLILVREQFNGDDICDLVARYKLHVREVVTYELGDFYQSESK